MLTKTHENSLYKKLLRSHLNLVFISFVIIIAIFSSTWVISRSANLLVTEIGPTAQLSSKVLNGIQASLAAMRGWVALGKNNFKKERRAAWKDIINPAMIGLKEKSIASSDNDLKLKLETATLLLNELEVSQWWIEDVAQTPGNNKAKSFVNKNIRDIEDNIINSISNLIEMNRFNKSSSKNQIENTLIKLNFYFYQAVSSLDRFVDAPLNNLKNQFDTGFDNLNVLLINVLKQKKHLSKEQLVLLIAIKNEIKFYHQFAIEVFSIRQNTTWNVAQYRLNTEAVPIAKKLVFLFETLSNDHSNKMLEQGNKIVQIMLVATIMAVFLIIFMIFVTVYISRKSAINITQPIIDISNTVKKLADGEVVFDLEVEGSDEIASLAKTFNFMRLRIELFQDNLQEEIERQTKKSTDAVRKLEDIFHSVSDAIFTIDSNKKVLTCNYAAENMFKLTEEKLLDINFDNLFIKKLKLPKQENIAKQSNRLSFKSVTENVAFRSGSGSGSGEFNVKMTVSEIKNKEGSIYTCLIRDVTQERLVKNELINAKRNAEKAAQLKSEFLASMSHEIRTPMNGVIGMLGLLSNSGLTDNQLKKANMAKSSAYSLLTIINDILDFSKIEANKMDLEVLDFDLHSFFGELAETMAITAQDKGLEIVLNIIGVEQAFVKGDPTRLMQILNNLLGNAIKFTAEGEVIITAELQKAENNKLLLNCSVKDTGIGIPEEKRKSLFNAFSQVDTSTTRKYGGTGLGLSIVKKLCELMNGNVSVRSRTLGGSCFEFSVQLEDSQQSKNILPPIDMDNIRLLIVDERESSRIVLAQQLAHWGAKVDETREPLLVMEMLQSKFDNDEKQYDAIFIDANLKDMSVTELSSKIKNNEKINNIKLIIMTSMAHPGDAKHFAQYGFSAYFPRPATTESLFSALAVLVDDSKALKDATPLVTQHYLKSLVLEKTNDTLTNKSINEVCSSVDDSSAKNSSIISDADLNQEGWPVDLQVLLVEDNEVNQLIVQGVLADTGLLIDIAENGQEAIKMLASSPQKTPYTVVLMDCQMPIMDGYTATKKIRLGEATARYRDIPIIALTANAMAGDRVNCIEAGMSDYLSKPIDADKLINLLKKWMS